MITFAFLAVLLIAVILLSLGIGATKISAAEIMGILTKRVGLSSNVGFTERQEAILMSIRLPRIIMGCLVGIALAVSGAALQGLFRNPLADPTLIGVSGGAMVGVVSFIVLGDRFISEIPEGFWKNLTLPLAGFLGGVTATSIAYRISTINKHTEITSMLLAGIAIGTLAGAIVGVFFYVSDDSQIRSITFWMLGSVAGATWNSIVSIFPFIAATAFILPSLGKHLNALLLGENVAFHIGAHVQKSKQIIILLTCLGIGAAVCVSGIIGFIGLVVPHLIRLAIGANHQFLLPASALLGGALLVLSDLIARTIVAPTEMPLGVITSILGGPFFLWLIYQNRQKLAA